MKKTDTKKVSDKAYRLMVPYEDRVDMAKKILQMYNGYLLAVNGEAVID